MPCRPLRDFPTSSKHLTTHPDIIYQESGGENERQKVNGLWRGLFFVHNALLCIGTEHWDGYYKSENEDVDNHLPLSIKGVGCFQYFIVCMVWAIEQMESVLRGWVRMGAGCVWQGEAHDVSHYYGFAGSQKLTSIRSRIRLPHTLTLLLLLQLVPQRLFLVFYQLNLKCLKQWRFHPLFPLETSAI